VTAPSLDEQIADAGGLISLLLVFVFAYFSALLPLFEEIRHRPKPAAKDDQEALVRRLSSYRALGCGLLSVVLLVLALLAPLSWHAVSAELWRPFRTLRVGLLVVDLLIIATGAGIALEVILLTKRRRQVR
jgi:hypothetical protein